MSEIAEEHIFPYEAECTDCNGKYIKRNPNHLYCRGCEARRMVKRERETRNIHND
jgi:hypothetical protein